MSAGATSSYHYVDSFPSLYKELKECMSEVERIEEAGRAANTNSSKNKELLKEKKEEEEQEEKEQIPIRSLDGYFIQSNANCK